MGQYSYHKSRSRRAVVANRGRCLRSGLGGSPADQNAGFAACADRARGVRLGFRGPSSRLRSKAGISFKISHLDREAIRPDSEMRPQPGCRRLPSARIANCLGALRNRAGISFRISRLDREATRPDNEMRPQRASRRALVHARHLQPLSAGANKSRPRVLEAQDGEKEGTTKLECILESETYSESSAAPSTLVLAEATVPLAASVRRARPHSWSLVASQKTIKRLFELALRAQDQLDSLAYGAEAAGRMGDVMHVRFKERMTAVHPTARPARIRIGRSTRSSPM